jgi:uncharacterized membrane protein YbhN (UPF0104 family)
MGIIGRQRWRLLVASIGVAAVGYLIFSLWAGWRDVTGAIGRVGWDGLAVLLGLSLLNYVLRFGRWQFFLGRLGARVPWSRSLVLYFAGFAVTTTPGKAGEAIRSVFLTRHRVSYVSGNAAFISERLSDLMAIVLLACIGLIDHPEARPVVLVGISACAIVLLLLAGGDALGEMSPRSDGPTSISGGAWHHVLDTLHAARSCHGPLVLIPATLVSLVAWSCEAWAFHLLLGWLGLQTSWSYSFFVYAVSMLAGALSFLPGGLGSTEGVMIGLLLWSGHPQADSIAATVLIRIATLWFAVLLGVLALGLVGRGRLGNPPRPQEPVTPGEAG